MEPEESPKKKVPRGKKARLQSAIERLSKVKPDFSVMYNDILPPARLAVKPQKLDKENGSPAKPVVITKCEEKHDDNGPLLEFEYKG